MTHTKTNGKANWKPSGKQKGNQTKTVTVSANTEPENTILKISANVNEPG